MLLEVACLPAVIWRPALLRLASVEAVAVVVVAAVVVVVPWPE